MEFFKVRCPSICLDLPVALPRTGSAASRPTDWGRSTGSVSAGDPYELPAHRDPKRGATVTQLPYSVCLTPQKCRDVEHIFGLRGAMQSITYRALALHRRLVQRRVVGRRKRTSGYDAHRRFLRLR